MAAEGLDGSDAIAAWSHVTRSLASLRQREFSRGREL